MNLMARTARRLMLTSGLWRVVGLGGVITSFNIIRRAIKTCVRREAISLLRRLRRSLLVLTVCSTTSLRRGSRQKDDSVNGMVDLRRGSKFLQDKECGQRSGCSETSSLAWAGRSVGKLTLWNTRAQNCRPSIVLCTAPDILVQTP